MPRPKLLQPWREYIELSASGCQIVQVLDRSDGRIVVGLSFGADECLDMLPELVDAADQAIQVAVARRCLCTGKSLTLALCLFGGGACTCFRPASGGTQQLFDRASDAGTASDLLRGWFDGVRKALEDLRVEMLRIVICHKSDQ
jgi:hypothetical protein